MKNELLAKVTKDNKGKDIINIIGSTKIKLKYLVALETGGLMECPELSYSNFQVILAESKKEACEEYNKQNDCSYFYGTVMAYLDKRGKTTVLNRKVSLDQLEILYTDPLIRVNAIDDFAEWEERNYGERR